MDGRTDKEAQPLPHRISKYKTCLETVLNWEIFG